MLRLAALALALALLLSTAANAQSIDGAGCSGTATTVTPTCTFSTTGGNDVIIAILLSPNGSDGNFLQNIYDTANLQWHQRWSNGYVAEYYALAGAPITNDTVNGSWINSQTSSIHVIAFQGTYSAATPIPNDPNVSTVPPLPALPPPYGYLATIPITTTVNNDCLVAAYEQTSAANPGAGSGWTAFFSANNRLVEYKCGAAAGTTTAPVGTGTVNYGVVDAFVGSFYVPFPWQHSAPTSFMMGQNLGGIAYYTTEDPFLNPLKLLAGPPGTAASSMWTTVNSGGSDTGQEACVPLDSNGYPTSLTAVNPGVSGCSPVNYVAVKSASPFLGTTSPYYPQDPNGWVLLFDGTGAVLGLNDFANQGLGCGTVLAPVTGGRCVSNVVPTGNGLGVKILSTDPNNVGDYVRNIRFVRARDELLLASQILNPDFVNLDVSTECQLRFMDWADTNSSQSVVNYSDIRPESYFNWGGWLSGDPIPVDALIETANETMSHPWIDMPFGAIARPTSGQPASAQSPLVTQYAEEILAKLNPKLHVFLQTYGNERWNGKIGYGWYVAAASWSGGTETIQTTFPVQGTFTGSASAVVLTVASVGNSLIHIGDTITGTGIPAGTTLVGQLSGNIGTTGNWITSQPTNSPGVAVTDTTNGATFTGTTSTLLMSVSNLSGTLTVGDAITCTDCPAGTTLVAPSGSSWLTSQPTGAASETVTDTTSGATFTGNVSSNTGMVATSVTGAIAVGYTLTGTGVRSGTTIVQPMFGATGGAGTYIVSNAIISNAAALTDYELQATHFTSIYGMQPVAYNNGFIQIQSISADGLTLTFNLASDPGTATQLGYVGSGAGAYAIALWGAAGANGYYEASGVLDVNNCQTWKQVWGSQADRITCVTDTQVGNTGVASGILACQNWAWGPCGYQQGLDVEAIATYFQGNFQNGWIAYPDLGIAAMANSNITGMPVSQLIPGNDFFQPTNVSWSNGVVTFGLTGNTFASSFGATFEFYATGMTPAAYNGTYQVTIGGATRQVLLGKNLSNPLTQNPGPVTHVGLIYYHPDTLNESKWGLPIVGYESGWGGGTSAGTFGVSSASWSSASGGQITFNGSFGSSFSVGSWFVVTRGSVQPGNNPFASPWSGVFQAVSASSSQIVAAMPTQPNGTASGLTIRYPIEVNGDFIAYDQSMYQYYLKAYQWMANVGMTATNHFNDIGGPGQYGDWGAALNIQMVGPSQAPRIAAMQQIMRLTHPERNATTPCSLTPAGIKLNMLMPRERPANDDSPLREAG